MKLVSISLLLLFLIGCIYLPNEKPKPEFSFEFETKLENLEDALHSSDLDYEEVDYTGIGNSIPSYFIDLVHHDTSIRFEFRLNGYQTPRYLFNTKCSADSNRSSLTIWEINQDQNQLSIVDLERIFQERVHTKLLGLVESQTTTYQCSIREISSDTTLLEIINNQGLVRKRYFYVEESNGYPYLREYVGYYPNSVEKYIFNEEQRYAYIKNKETTYSSSN